MENPFIFGEIVEPTPESFVDREDELRRLVQDLADGQKVFLLSPRRFGKSSLVAMVFQKLQKQHVRTVTIPVSSYSSYGQFLEKFAEKVIRSAGHWERAKNWVTHFLRRVRPTASYEPNTGDVSLSFGFAPGGSPAELAPDVFALPGELSTNGNFRMAICLDEFQQVQAFDSGTVENTLREAVQRQRQVGYVFAGSQPSLMDEMLSVRRPFHKSGPPMFLEKIPSAAWREFIDAQFAKRKRVFTDAAFGRLSAASDLIPYDVQRLAHELWDDAELRGAKRVEAEDVNRVLAQVVASQATYFERQWEQLSSRQRALLQAIASHGSDDLFSELVRQEYRLGPASTVQKALQALRSQSIIDRYHGRFFFLDPLFSAWIEGQIR
jgi:hypothetical protein